MSIIYAEDLIESIADALQFISYYHPPDYLQALHEAYLIEESRAARDAMAQILINSRMCAEGRRPICQDTGIVNVFLKVGMDVRWQSDKTLQEMVDEGVRRAYLNPDNPLRASVLDNPLGKRNNTRDNTPAVVSVELVAGDQVSVHLAAKGGGSEAKARFAMLNPSDSLLQWVLETVPGMGAGWCPPGILGIGVGGTAEKAMLLAKESLMGPVDLAQVRARGAQTEIEQLRIDITDAINGLGIGAQGLGGLTTVLDVKINDYPCHAANLPVAMIPNCAATRHTGFVLCGQGPSLQSVPDLATWPKIAPDNNAEQARRVDLEHLTRAEIKSWRPGETLLLSGKLLTARDAAHKRLQAQLQNHEPLPDGVDLTDRFIYYVGPVDAVRDEPIGPAGPTTATRMDKFSHTMLADTGLLGMIGKAECGPATIDAIKQHAATYLIAVGGAAYLISQSIKKARVIAYADLGMEAIHEFEVVDMPVTVAVDTLGNSVHKTGPSQWKKIILQRAEQVAQ